MPLNTQVAWPFLMWATAPCIVVVARAVHRHVELARRLRMGGKRKLTSESEADAKHVCGGDRPCLRLHHTPPALRRGSVSLASYQPRLSSTSAFPCSRR